MTDVVPPEEASNKCCFRSCAKVPKKSEPPTMVTCMAANCGKTIHQDCCEKIRQQYNLKASIPKTSGGDQALYYCTKGCHDKIFKSEEGTGRPVPWSQDGPGGKHDKIGNSERLLVDWLVAADNYSNYCGPKNGDTKTKVAARISELFKSSGVVVERSPKSIISKIEGIEQQFKKALHWTENTGQGVKEQDEANFWEVVERMCPYFKYLEPKMGKRSKMRPLATNEDLSSDDDDGDDPMVAGIGNFDGDESSDDEDIENKETETETVSDLSKDDSASSSPLSLKRVREQKKRQVTSTKKASTGTKKAKPLNKKTWDDDPMAALLVLKQKEHKWSQKEQEQEYKMKCLTRVKELLGAPFNMTGNQILRFLGDDAKCILEILGEDF